MKKKLKKSSGVKATGSGQSAENNTGNINSDQPVRLEEYSKPRNILIDYDTNADDLYQDLLEESYEKTPRDITMYVVDAKEFSLEDIENLSEMINKRNLIINLYAVKCIDFTGFALFGLCVTGEVYFSANTDIHMESLNSIPKNELDRISKKISERIDVEANVVSVLYNQKAIVEPGVLFPDDSNANNMENIITVNNDTDLHQLGIDLIAESNEDNNTKQKQLMINNAKTFKISEIEKLSNIIKNIPLKVHTFVLEDMDMTELAFTLLCSNSSIFITAEVKTTMDTLVPLSDDELKRISKIIAKFTGKDVEEILKYYKNKDIIDLNMILKEKNEKLKK